MFFYKKFLIWYVKYFIRKFSYLNYKGFYKWNKNYCGDLRKEFCLVEEELDEYFLLY